MMWRHLRFAASVGAAASACWLLPAGTGFQPWTVAVIFGLTLLLDLSDLWLPHGENLSVDGALAATSIILVGGFPTLVVGMTARVFAGLLRRDGRSLASSIERRMIGLVAGVACSSWTPSLTTYAAATIKAVAVASALMVAELVYSQVTASRQLDARFMQLVTGNLRLQGPILLAQVSVCGLAVMTYGQMSAWSLIVATVLLLLIRQAYASLLEVRQAYRSTVELLIDAAEGIDESRRGHAERVAGIARLIARRLGIGAAEIERLSYAALLHDVDLISQDTGADGEAGRCAGRVVQGVEFLKEVAPILSLCDGSETETLREEDLRDAFIVALASDIDSLTQGAAPSAVYRVSPRVPATTKGRIVGAALSLGLTVPSVSA